MTIRIPRKTIGDKVLKALGRKRGVHIPSETYKEFGAYAYAKAQKERFLRALLRPRDRNLPDGMIDIDDYRKESDLSDRTRTG